MRKLLFVLTGTLTGGAVGYFAGIGICRTFAADKPLYLYVQTTNGYGVVMLSDTLKVINVPSTFNRQIGTFTNNVSILNGSVILTKD